MECSNGALKFAFCLHAKALKLRSLTLTSGSFLASKQLFAEESEMNEWTNLLNNMSPIKAKTACTKKNINTGNMSQHGEAPFFHWGVMTKHFYNLIALQ